MVMMIVAYLGLPGGPSERPQNSRAPILKTPAEGDHQFVETAM